MKKGDIARGLRALVSSNYVLLLLWVLYWPVSLPKLTDAFSQGGAVLVFKGGPLLLLLGVATWFLWQHFLAPAYELLICRGLVERTVHINWAKFAKTSRGLGSCSVKTCEIREGLRYHEPIPEDMIVNKRLTIGYLPKSRIILYVQKPEA